MSLNKFSGLHLTLGTDIAKAMSGWTKKLYDQKVFEGDLWIPEGEGKPWDIRTTDAIWF